MIYSPELQSGHKDMPQIAGSSEKFARKLPLSDTLLPGDCWMVSGHAAKIRVASHGNTISGDPNDMRIITIMSDSLLRRLAFIVWPTAESCEYLNDLPKSIQSSFRHSCHNGSSSRPIHEPYCVNGLQRRMELSRLCNSSDFCVNELEHRRAHAAIQCEGRCPN